MTLENQVVSLELAQKLKQLGVKQESAFYWCEYTHSVEQESGYGEIQTDWLFCPASEMKRRGLDVGLCIAAFTVAELGEILPAYILMENGEGNIRFDLNVWKDAGWHVAYWWDEDTRRGSDWKVEVFVEANEAAARTKMLIYLIENNLITI